MTRSHAMTFKIKKPVTCETGFFQIIISTLISFLSEYHGFLITELLL
jgi:hypothetical protein